MKSAFRRKVIYAEHWFGNVCMWCLGLDCGHTVDRRAVNGNPTAPPPKTTICGVCERKALKPQKERSTDA